MTATAKAARFEFRPFEGSDRNARIVIGGQESGHLRDLGEGRFAASVVLDGRRLTGNLAASDLDGAAKIVREALQDDPPRLAALAGRMVGGFLDAPEPQPAKPKAKPAAKAKPSKGATK